jgi:PilZ domain.
MLDEQPVETTLFSLASIPPSEPERRGGERNMSLLRVGSLHVGNRRELCLIRNISVGGMVIRAYSKIHRGARLCVELKQGERVEGTALWTERELVGVGFDSPIDVLSLISTTDGSPRPRMPRLEVRCTALIRDGATIHRTRAVNISQGGLRVEGGKGLTAGAQVTVTLPNLSPELGVVRWNDGCCCGITFNRVLALPLLVEWLGEQQERQREAG